MPDRAKSSIEIAQRACILSGMNRIDDFTEPGSTEAVVLNTIYEDLVRECLSATRWNFATARKILTSRNDDPPLTGYGAAYVYLGDDTDDVLQVNTVEVNGTVVDYDISENEIHLDCNETDEVVMTYTRRVDENYWPPFFSMYVVLRVAAVLAASIVRNEGMASSFDKQAASQLVRARSADSQQVTTRKLHRGRLLGNRMVGGFR